MKISVIVTDSSPLITLALADALDTLIALGLPVHIPDMVRYEVTRAADKPGATEVREWIVKHGKTGQVIVDPTETFDEYQDLIKLNPARKIKDRGEAAAAEVLNTVIGNSGNGAILIFEDQAVKQQNFLRQLPGTVYVMSTSEYLHRLEKHHYVADADAILNKAVLARGAEVKVRHLKTPAGLSEPELPVTNRMKP